VAVVSDRRYRYPVEPAVVWRALCDVPAYPTWWPWLCEFDGRRLAAGQVWTCRVRSPLRLALEFRLRIDRVDDGHGVAASLTGELEGPATLTVSHRGDGTEIRLVSQLTPRGPGLGTLATIAAPLARWAHDRLIDTGARQFGAGLGRP
jgi:hypothetical protein